jgi:hypothetical protein
LIVEVKSQAQSIDNFENHQSAHVNQKKYPRGKREFLPFKLHFKNSSQSGKQIQLRQQPNFRDELKYVAILSRRIHPTVWRR